MENTIYYISEASKKVDVEPHVLRYWEDELNLTIGRNEMGHRYYTGKDIETLCRIKELKEQGLQLKAIRLVLHGSSSFTTGEAVEESTMRTRETDTEDGSEMKTDTETVDTDIKDLHVNASEKEMVQAKVEDMVMKKAKKYMVTMSKGKETVLEMPEEELKQYEEPIDSDKENKAKRLQYLLQHMVTDAVKNANKEMCAEIKESILKELDYQFRQQEERDEERRKRDEEHYRKIDEMISQRRQPRERFGRGKKKEPISPK